MKQFHLSTPSERIKGIAFSVIVSALLIVLLVVLRENLGVFLLTLAGVVPVIAIFALYVLNVAKAACVPDAENRAVRITGVRERTIDLSNAAYLETITVKSGHIETRSLAFTDAEGGVVGIVPTYFTSNRGVLAEPMARELAAALNLKFKANVPAWEYDEEARKVHDAEIAKQEKEDAKARREARKERRAAKIRKKMDEQRSSK